MILADLKTDGMRILVVRPPHPDVESEIAAVTGLPIAKPYSSEVVCAIGAWEGCLMLTCKFSHHEE